MQASLLNLHSSYLYGLILKYCLFLKALSKTLYAYSKASFTLMIPNELLPISITMKLSKDDITTDFNRNKSFSKSLRTNFSHKCNNVCCKLPSHFRANNANVQLQCRHPIAYGNRSTLSIGYKLICQSAQQSDLPNFGPANCVYGNSDQTEHYVISKYRNLKPPCGDRGL